jgi:outer membrane protein assembly factor BamB
MKRIVIATALLATLAGCGIFRGESKPKTALVGERMPILTFENEAAVDPALADVPVMVPEATANSEWTQPGGNAGKTMGHLALSTSPSRIWSAGIQGSSNRARLAAAPVVAGETLYVVDTEARLHALDAGTGRERWSARVGDASAKDNRSALFGGGVSFDNGRVYATNGIGDVAAYDATSGTQLWLVRPGGPMRGAPTVANGLVYATTQDSQIFALKQADGAVVWNEAAALETAGIFGTAAPAAGQGTVVEGFASGELNAYRYENGRLVWQDTLSRTSVTTSVASLSDIDASPVIEQGIVYAIGQGGRMVALELITGQRLWELNIAGIETPWVAGEWMFVVTDDARLFCIQRATGKVRWSSQLPRWRDQKDKKGPIGWNGPVLAGGRLILVSTQGRMAYVSPADGAIQATVKLDDEYFLPPVVANGTLYLLNNKGRLTAWR